MSPFPNTEISQFVRKVQRSTYRSLVRINRPTLLHDFFEQFWCAFFDFRRLQFISNRNSDLQYVFDLFMWLFSVQNLTNNDTKAPYIRLGAVYFAFDRLRCLEIYRVKSF